MTNTKKTAEGEVTVLALKALHKEGKTIPVNGKTTLPEPAAKKLAEGESPAVKIIEGDK